MFRTLLVVALAGIGQPTQVDFKMQAAPTLPVPVPGPISLAPDAVPTSPAVDDEESSRRVVVRTARRAVIPVVQGFGTDIPLEFAVKQIMPRKLKVYYGKDVDRDLQVSWHGGRSWQQTLRSLVVPLGMHVSTSAGTIRITK